MTEYYVADGVTIPGAGGAGGAGGGAAAGGGDGAAAKTTCDYGTCGSGSGNDGKKCPPGYGNGKPNCPAGCTASASVAPCTDVAAGATSGSQARIPSIALAVFLWF